MEHSCGGGRSTKAGPDLGSAPAVRPQAAPSLLQDTGEMGARISAKRGGWGVPRQWQGHAHLPRAPVLVGNVRGWCETGLGGQGGFWWVEMGEMRKGIQRGGTCTPAPYQKETWPTPSHDALLCPTGNAQDSKLHTRRSRRGEQRGGGGSRGSGAKVRRRTVRDAGTRPLRHRGREGSEERCGWMG